jgi:hypothetical protein
MISKFSVGFATRKIPERDFRNPYAAENGIMLLS